jgi:hypothetical protein
MVFKKRADNGGEVDPNNPDWQNGIAPCTNGASACSIHASGFHSVVT